MKLKKTKITGYHALIRVFETRGKIIDVCNCTPQAISRWAKNNRVPIYRREALIAAAAARGWLLTDEQLRGDL